jgi:hypothetical protein
MTKYVCAMLIATSIILFASPALAQSRPWSEVFAGGNGRFAVLQRFKGEAVLGVGCPELKNPPAAWCVRGGAGHDAQ